MYGAIGWPSVDCGRRPDSRSHIKHENTLKTLPTLEPVIVPLHREAPGYPCSADTFPDRVIPFSWALPPNLWVKFYELIRKRVVAIRVRSQSRLDFSLYGISRKVRLRPSIDDRNPFGERTRLDAQGASQQSPILQSGRVIVSCHRCHCKLCGHDQGFEKVHLEAFPVNWCCSTTSIREAPPRCSLRLS